MASGAESFLRRLVGPRTSLLLLLPLLLPALLGVPAARASYQTQGGGECQGKMCAGSGAAETKSDPVACDRSTCRFGGVCRDDRLQPKCVCQFQCHKKYVPVCGSNGDTYQNECFRRQASCKQQRLISRVAHGPCADGQASLFSTTLTCRW